MCENKINKEVPVGILERFSNNTEDVTPKNISCSRILRKTNAYNELDDYNMRLILDLIKEEA